jgi:CheY-like chemotaxis protein
MEQNFKYSFDLASLLKISDLGIRGIAVNFPLLTMGEYFCLLSDFLALAPKALDALNKIASQKDDEESIKYINDMKVILRSLGYNRITPVLNAIIDANKKYNVKFAAECAKNISNDFQRLLDRIFWAARTETDDSMSWELPIRVVLQQFDNKEATRRMLVLAVDDSPVVLKSIHSTLIGYYDVHTLGDPMLVEKFLQEVTPELFLLDYKMPGRDGFELVPVIRNFEEHGKTPIIFLTSMGTSDNVSAAAMLGAVDFIVKPFQGNILREKVEKHIVRKKLY